MHIDFLLDRFRTFPDREAIIWHDQPYTYSWLSTAIARWRSSLGDDLPRGAVVAIEADFSPNAVALFLALLDRSCILVPLTNSVASKREEFLEIAQVERMFRLSEEDVVRPTPRTQRARHPLYEHLRALGHPGLVLFSSGSTGRSKAAVHDMTGLLEKFVVPRQTLRTITFLLYDHIGGVNTMFYTLSNGGCMVTLQDRSPDSVLAAVDRYGVELLPTSPTFINLVLLSEAHRRHTLRSLRVVTYGTEPMPESVLRRFHAEFPHLQLQQTYGLSEVGILRSKSKSSDSLWVRLGGEGFETRVVEGILHIKAVSAMLGYLNAPSPFTDDGWFNTGDAVEVDGEYFRILGRKSEMINVGGEKVYPAEVESVLQEMPDIAEATVYGEPNPITGQIVCARVVPVDESIVPATLAARVKTYCRSRLQRFKVPVKVLVALESQHSERFKKRRAG